MPDTRRIIREALTELLSDHRFLRHTSSEGDVCYCGWRDHDEPHGQHAADVLLEEYLVVPRSDIVSTEYGMRYSDGVVFGNRDRGRAVRVAERLHEVEAVQRPLLPWSVIPLPEDGLT